MSAAPPAQAWLLPVRPLPVGVATAAELRFSRLQRWLEELGYRPVVFERGWRARRDISLEGAGARSTGLAAGLGAAARQRAALLLDAVLCLAAAPRLALLARHSPPALVVTNTALYGPALAALKALHGPRLRTVVDVMGLQSLEVDQTTAMLLRPLHRRIWRGLERVVIRAADLVLTVNRRHADLVQRRGARRVRVLRDGAESELTDLAAASRVALGIPEDVAAVCFVGSLVYSRLEPVFGAWGELCRLAGESGPAPSPVLVIVGDGPDRAAYERRAAAAGWLGQAVLFLGALPRREALRAARACDIAYSDCWSEAGFPVKLFEYLALGLPTVVEGKPQMAEVLTDDVDALFWHTPEELAQRIRQLVEQPRLRRRVGNAGRRRFLRGCTLADRRREFEGLLDAL